MNDRLTTALAVAGGYVLGRTGGGRAGRAPFAFGVAATLVLAAARPESTQRLLVALGRTLGRAAGKVEALTGRAPHETPGEQRESGASDEADETDEADEADDADEAGSGAGVADDADGPYAAAGERS
ncbi:hypothetical protein [Streptomyces sp. 891-h]|uniref:hypothetical protein n=1 Tax=Streptomyces sp. 891-h TaxID=2720714 RepID=UPI001FA9955A|nr:hypothetical protein [Streptomyces sp. 891-h]UNZ20182.1 hypothetical protein HC362_27155 [Streptomyces sp. 891-h]